uniref:SARAH domain-containing protein n=1 Tax=Pundamilia nyererei TaxID=303518 RepID=A0A3B4GAN9_9CICH
MNYCIYVLNCFLFQAIFMIPTNPPPTFRNPDLWSPGFRDFVSQCLVKNPENRATATQLLQHPFIKSAKPNSILRALITDAMEIKLKRQEEEQREQDDEDEVDQGTMVRAGTGDSGTIRAAGSLGSSLGSTAGTMIEHDDTGTLQSQLGTMVINSNDDEDYDDDEDAGTMKSNNSSLSSQLMSGAKTTTKLTLSVCKSSCVQSFHNKEVFGLNLLPCRGPVYVHGDSDSPLTVSTWSVEDLRLKLASLDPQMEQEIEEIRQRYQSKRQPILDAIEAKKRRQPNF